MKYRAKIDEKTCDSCLVKDGSDSLAPNPDCYNRDNDIGCRCKNILCENCGWWAVDPGGNKHLLPPGLAEAVRDKAFKCIETHCNKTGELTRFDHTCNDWKPIPDN